MRTKEETEIELLQIRRTKVKGSGELWDGEKELRCIMYVHKFPRINVIIIYCTRVITKIILTK